MKNIDWVTKDVYMFNLVVLFYLYIQFSVDS